MTSLEEKYKHLQKLKKKYQHLDDGAIANAEATTDYIRDAGELIDNPSTSNSTIEAIAEASRDKNFMSPKIHKPELITAFDYIDRMPDDRKPAIWKNIPENIKVELKKRAIEAPTKETPTEIQAMIDALNAPVQRVGEGIRGMSGDYSQIQESVKKAIEAIPERQRPRAYQEIPKDVRRKAEYSPKEGYLDVLGGAVETTFTPFTAPMAGITEAADIEYEDPISGKTRNLGEDISQGVGKVFEMPFAVLEFGSDVVGEGMRKMGWDIDLDNPSIDKKAKGLLVELGGLGVLSGLHGKAKSFVEKRMPVPKMTKNGVRFTENGKFISKEKVKEKIEDIKKELPEEIVNNPNLEVVGRGKSGKPKLRYKREAKPTGTSQPKGSQPEYKMEGRRVSKNNFVDNLRTSDATHRGLEYNGKKVTKENKNEILTELGNNAPAVERMMFEGKKPKEIADALNIKESDVIEFTKKKDRFISDELYLNAVKNTQRLSMGLDPTLLKDYSIIGAYHLENLIRSGVTKGSELYKKWSNEMRRVGGKDIEPHLLKIYSELHKTNKKKEIIDFNKERGFGKRVAEMPQFEKEAPKIKENPESYYTEQDLGKVKEEIASMSDKDLDVKFNQYIESATNIDNTGVLAGLEKINRKIAKGESPIETINALNKAGTPFGQLIRQYGELKGSSPEGMLAILEGKFTKEGLTISEGKRNRLKSLVEPYVKKKSEAQQFLKTLQKEPSEANALKLIRMQKEAQKLESDVTRFMNRYLPRKASDVYVGAMKAGLMSTTSLTKNPQWNIFGEFTPRQIRKLLVTPLDWAHSKLTGKQRTHYIDGRYYVETLKGAWEGVKEAAEIFTSGRHQFINEKYEISKGFQPFNAWFDLFSKDLPKNAKGKTPLSYRYSKFLEGTLGLPAEFIFRGLPFGDLPFATATARATKYELGKIKGVNSKEMQAFMSNPDKITAEIAGLESQKAVFMNSTQFTNSILQLTPESGWGKILFTSQMPYVKVPTNALMLMIDYSFPMIPAVKAMKFAKKASKEGAKSDKYLAYRRQAYDEFGKAMVGSMMHLAAEWMAANDVISGELSSNPKERAIEYQTKPPRSLNLTRLEKLLKGENLPPGWTAGDRKIDYETFGGLGVNFMIWEQFYRENKDLMGKPLGTRLSGIGSSPNKLLSLSTSAAFGGSKFLANQSIAQGVQGFLGALLSNDPNRIQRWFENTTEVLVAPILPNQLSNINRMHQDYIVQKKGDTFKETFLNILESKSPFSAPKNAVYIRDVWGRKIKRPKDFLSNYGNVFYFFKTAVLPDDPFTFEVYDLYTKTGDTSIIPPAVRGSIVSGGETIELTKRQHEEFQELVGLHRMKRFSRINRKLDDENFIKEATKVYREGYEDGKREFIKRHKELGIKLKPPKIVY